MHDEFMRLHGPFFATMGFGVEVDESGNASLYELEEGGAMLHGTSQRDGSINMSVYPDLGARMKAANDLLDRHFGRPRQAVALTGDGAGPILLRIGALLDPVAAGHAAELAGRLAIEADSDEAWP
jgi:hypothetical protein